MNNQAKEIPREPTVPEAKFKPTVPEAKFKLSAEEKAKEFRRRVREMQKRKMARRVGDMAWMAKDHVLVDIRNQLANKGDVASVRLLNEMRELKK